MGKKLRAAKTSLVVAFLAAGGAASATGAKSSSAGTNTAGERSVGWNDPLVRFLKLDGLASYLKVRSSSALALSYKAQLESDAAELYQKYPSQVAGVLALYQKAGTLDQMLKGLEAVFKDNNAGPLTSYLKSSAGLESFIKFDEFLGALAAVDPGPHGAFAFWLKNTGASSNALQELGGLAGSSSTP